VPSKSLATDTGYEIVDLQADLQGIKLLLDLLSEIAPDKKE
jgi:hypothetical protein